jgi:transposase
MAGTASAPLRLSRRVRVAIEKRARSQREPHRIVVRAQIVVLACAGRANADIARQLRVSVSMVTKWRERIVARPQVSTLEDARRSGRPAVIPIAVRCELVKLACARPAGQKKVPAYAQLWTRPRLQKALQAETGYTLSLSEIGRTLRCGGLRPHRVRLWLHSQDPEFRPKVETICKLYTSPPAGATVLCIDEKPGMQAIEHLNPTRFSRRDGETRREFEYIRHGTSTLLAAFDIGTGAVVGRIRRRTAKGLMLFMEEIAALHPSGDVYVVWDNLNIHHGPRWKEFNARHGNRFHFVHTPLHASWVNQVEIWFSLLSRAVLKNASFASRGLLAAAVRSYIAEWNHIAHPFRWTFRGDFRAHGLLSAA